MRVLSRVYVVASIALLSPTVTSAYRTIRRSLNFKPRLNSDFSIDSLPVLASRDPYQVARAFLHKLAYPSGSYIIREDSYTDANTGISHIYVRQVVNGLEVANADINLSIRGGQVLSHGNSFFKGSVESDALPVPNWHQAVYCSEGPTRPADPACGYTLDHIQAIALHHEFGSTDYHRDPRAASYFLLHAAHPDPASLDLSLATLSAEHSDCTVTREGKPCNDWLVNGLPEGLKPIHARQVYVQTPGDNGSTYLNLAWRLELSLARNIYIGYVSVHDPSKIISMADMVVDAPSLHREAWPSLQSRLFGQDQEIFPSYSPAPVNSNHADPSSRTPISETGTYHVWKWGVNDPASGERTLEVAPTDRRASPLGWHSVPAKNDPLKTHPGIGKNEIVNYTTTVGNNVIAQENWGGDNQWETRGRPDGGPNLIFDFPYSDKVELAWKYANASITQLFYTANMYHDLMYLYGFDEPSGNFQQHNFGKKGKEGDAIILEAQDGRGGNGAFFTKTEDGTKPVCAIFMWDQSRPSRDGAFDAGILIHELSHGLSGRLTGGPGRLECLDWHVAEGLGEGWSDFIATTVRSTSIYRKYPIAAWASNDEKGIRRKPYYYSKDMEVNHWLYDEMRNLTIPHDIGAVWAEILYVVSNKLIDKHGFSDSLFPSAGSDFYRLVPHDDGVLAKVPKHGNTLMLQLIVNAMKLQKCNPSFIEARCAIIKADEILTGGENYCTLWKAFASRGLGTNAKEYVSARPPNLNGFEFPSDCE